MSRPLITIAGAGILGLWQALTLARGGHRVRLVDQSSEPAETCTSRHAGAMLAPDCEAESTPAEVRDFGRQGLDLWRAYYPQVVGGGSLVVAGARDQPELTRFARMTQGHRTIDRAGVARLEPDLADRFETALFFADEGHVVTPQALSFLLSAARDAGAAIHLGTPCDRSEDGDIVIDCTGLGARDALPNLRGVRGERVLIATRDIRLSRPVRLLHPRHPLYIVPWGNGRYLIGATMVESEDLGPITVRSALELLGAAYAVHPAFGEAAVLETGAGVRPAFPDNVPRAIVRDSGRRIYVNGAYRHGYLLAPVLAAAVRDFIEQGWQHPLISIES